MRLVKLSVERFQCIENAELELGPGLNVLFGPNDLGKSSLAWAIRAVLLLQHNSSHHERFVSWYGDAAPRVSLTFTDATNRYWRVTKTFGGANGRSLLETSKDGVSFSADANARQVDEKLRKLLGWGIPAPGGAGGGRGFPDSFLAQVLLSEQDNVRKVLFDTSLTKDGDESGRQRLTEALGALAQDPLFKKVLDDAQERVDEAFTKTGRKKRAAGSPFVETAERIKGIQRDLDALVTKVRDTELAERRISTLLENRDELARACEAARTELERLEAAYANTRRRAELRQQIIVHEDQLRDAQVLRDAISAGEREHASLADQVRAGGTELQVVTDQLATASNDLAAARKHQESTLLSVEDDRTRHELEQRIQTQRQHRLAVGHELERCRERESAARAAAKALEDASRDLARLEHIADEAERARVEASTRHEREIQALEHAKEQLRDATSDDQVRSRELRRSELDNQRLARTAALSAAESMQRQLAELRDCEQRLRTAERSGEERKGQADAISQAIEATTKELVRNDESERAIQLLQTYAQLRTARASLNAAEATNAQLDKDRARAATLRDEARSLRAKTRTDLPTAAAAGELRRLSEELRVAEARLGGGLSLVIRPRRELELRTRSDGGAEATTRTVSIVTLSAERSIALSIDDLVDLELIAGEESTRARAQELKARWAEEGEAMLRAIGLANLNELDQAIAGAESSRRRAEELEREAIAFEQRVNQAAPSDLGPLAARVHELESGLSGANENALADGLDKLGPKWAKDLQDGLAFYGSTRANLTKKLEEQRTQLARLTTQLESDTPALATLRDECQRRLAALGGDPRELATTTSTRLVELKQELAQLDHQLAAVMESGGELAPLRERVRLAEQSLQNAKRVMEDRTRAASEARVAVAQCRARRESAAQRAGEIDLDGTWRAALASGGPLDVSPWSDATRRTVQKQSEVEQACQKLEQELQERAKARKEAVESAQSAVRVAEHRAAQLQQRLSSVREACQRRESEATAKLLSVADMKARLAGLHVEAASAEIVRIRTALAALPGDDNVDEATLARARQDEQALQARHKECVEELARARGALEQVGGAIVREQRSELEDALKRETGRERELEIEYDAWKLLVDTMRETETQEGAHLGRALAGPVSERFQRLTRGRYGSLELGAHLEGTGVQIEGQTREFSALSAGTQDQLATLLRLCVAEQLRTAIVLDDHLSQSDPSRVSWFDSILRTAAHQSQIIFITCRPSELLTDAEMPASTEAMRISAAGHIRAIDLSRVIRRFAAENRAAGLTTTAQIIEVGQNTTGGKHSYER